MRNWKRFTLYAIALTIVLGCAPDAQYRGSPTAPTLAAPGIQTDCSTVCELTTDARPYRASRASADSAQGTIFLAEVALTGKAGSEVSLQLVSGESPALALPNDSWVSITDGQSEKRFALSALRSAPIVVYRFNVPGLIHLRYALSRGGLQTIPLNDLRLTQSVTSAEVVTANRPWVRSRSAAFDITTSSGCFIAAASSNVCGIDVTANPFFGQTNVGGTFQSAEGNGISSTIEVDFAAPVNAVTVTVYDPTFAGNAARIYDAAGISLGTVYFKFSGQGGVNIPDTRTIAHPGIRRLDLIPAPEDYVAYDVGFDTAPQPPGPPPCPFPPLATYDSITTEFGAVDPTHPDPTKPHGGRDYKVATHTEVFSADSGTVLWAEKSGDAGMEIVVRNGNVDTYYMHMESFSVSEGQHVAPGQRLGYSDNTGHSSGPHLHLEQHSPVGSWPFNSKGKPPRNTVVAPCTI